MANDYMATMGQIATVCRRIAGGRDINGYLIPGANLWDIGPLVAELQRLLDEYDQQMLKSTKHCMASDYKEWEQRQTCVSCGHPLADNQLVKDAYKLNTTATWAKQQLSVLSDMAKARHGMDWFAEKAQKIADGIRLLDASKTNNDHES